MNEFEYKYNLVYSVVKGLIQGSPAFDPEITDKAYDHQFINTFRNDVLDWIKLIHADNFDKTNPDPKIVSMTHSLFSFILEMRMKGALVGITVEELE